MMRSMYAGVSGLRNHQTRMDVLGNNIANVNTTGYKKSRVVFKDTFYQASQGATRPTTERGGTNPMAVGLGMTTASIDQIHTPAPTTTTNKTTDMAVSGNGYFAVNTSTTGGNRYYTRAGAFDFDADGKLVSTANGYQVQGWTTSVDATTGKWSINTSGEPKGISLSSFKSLEANPTTEMKFSGNLDSNMLAPNEVQTLTLTGAVVAGDYFQLGYSGQTTAPIRLGATTTATAANIQTALENMSTIGTGNVAVAYDAANSWYNVTFQGTLAGKDLPTVSFVPGVASTAALAAHVDGAAGVNEQDTITPGAGYYTLTTTIDGTALNTATTAPIAGNATAAEIQAALISAAPALSGNISVSAGRVVTYIGTLANTNVANLVMNPVVPTAATGTIATVNPMTLIVPTATNTRTVTRDVYDSEGNKVQVNFRFTKLSVDNSGIEPVNNWICDISLNPLYEKAPSYATTDMTAFDINSKTASLPVTGSKIIRVTGLQFNDAGKIEGQQPDLDPFKLTLDRGMTGASPIAFNIDFNSLTQYSGTSTAWAEKQNGYEAGALTSYTIGTDGTITGIYDNEETRSLAQVALFTFENPSGLKQMGGSLFSTTSNSGDPKKGAPGVDGKGTIIPGSLEMSNVDLSEEFTDMIVTQRGFQANSRIITTSDEMLQELVNLKR